MLLEKSLEAGWRVAVHGTDIERLKMLDEKLWLGPEDGFLPHGLAGGDHDAQQPVLLTTGEATNDPQCVMSIDGAEISPDMAQAKERTFILFDGLDGDAVQRARVQWKAMTGAGVAAQYWAQEAGRWVMKAES
ncbi:MAG: DNA polymerase III subunit chi [Rhodobacteraceae bacterium]|nr:DNA polymerase III subunit chi [Paracoccaceae bacterium]